MSQNFEAGDYLIFQVESGYGLLRLLAIDETERGRVWHLKSYSELFPDIESADAALAAPDSLTEDLRHVALTNRAFEATQTARMLNRALTGDESGRPVEWRAKGTEPVDRSIRLILGLR